MLPLICPFPKQHLFPSCPQGHSHIPLHQTLTSFHLGLRLGRLGGAASWRRELFSSCSCFALPWIYRGNSPAFLNLNNFKNIEWTSACWQEDSGS